MSRYQTSYSGTIKFKFAVTDETIDKFTDALINEAGFDNDGIEYDSAKKVVSFDGYGGYYDMEIYALLTANEHNMESGVIEYAGEDDAHWKHELDPITGHWTEIAGYIAYEEEGKPLSEIYDAEIKRFPELYRPHHTASV